MQEVRSHEILTTLILNLQESSPEYFANLFISKLIHIYFNHSISRFFPVFFNLLLCFPCTFSYFLLRKAASCSRYMHCYSRKLEFNSNLGLNNSPSLFRSLSIYILQPPFHVIHRLHLQFFIRAIILWPVSA